MGNENREGCQKSEQLRENFKVGAYMVQSGKIGFRTRRETGMGASETDVGARKTFRRHNSGQDDDF